MAESVIADFVARFLVGGSGRAEPVRGRVLLSPERLVLASDEDTEPIPLSSVFDVAVGQVPPDLSEFFDHTVTIGYIRGDDQRTTVIEADGETVDRFTSVLFKALINGSRADVIHPARVGGRVTGASAQQARLKLRERAVAFTESDPPFTIDLHAVVRFEQQNRTVSGDRQAALSITHVDEGQTTTSIIALSSYRKQNVLGRYLRLEYSELMAGLEAVELSEEETRVLVALYTGGDDVDIARQLGVDTTHVPVVLQALEQKGLVLEQAGDRKLTSKGWMAAVDRIESVNA